MPLKSLKGGHTASLKVSNVDKLPHQVSKVNRMPYIKFKRLTKCLSKREQNAQVYIFVLTS